MLTPDDSRCAAGETCGADGTCLASVMDAGPPDTRPVDTGPPDTRPADTNPPDTRPMTTGRFCPDDPLLRQHMASFLVRYQHGVGFIPPAAVGTFSDVSTSSIFAPYIEQLARDGITAGCNPGLFCPGEPVLRQQAATFLVRAHYGPSYRPPGPTGVFTDVSPTNVHAPAIEQIYRDGLTRGCGEGLYCPTDALLRRYLAVFLVRLVHGASFTPPAPVGLFSDVPVTDREAPYIEQLAWDGFTLGC